MPHTEQPARRPASGRQSNLITRKVIYETFGPDGRWWTIDGMARHLGGLVPAHSARRYYADVLQGRGRESPDRTIQADKGRRLMVSGVVGMMVRDGLVESRPIPNNKHVKEFRVLPRPAGRVVRGPSPAPGLPTTDDVVRVIREAGGELTPDDLVAALSDYWVGRDAELVDLYLRARTREASGRRPACTADSPDVVNTARRWRVARLAAHARRSGLLVEYHSYRTPATGERSAPCPKSTAAPPTR